MHQQLGRIGKTLQSLNESCEVMKRHVAAARVENSPVLDEASTLLGQKRELETKNQLLDAFRKHFIIDEADLVLLTSASSPVNDAFFAILKRVNQIHSDCRVLLGSENQRLGLELMEESSRHLNAAYQKLFRWTQHEFKGLNLESPQINSVIRRALRALAERPTLFQTCLDFFAESREHVLTDAFYTALTGSANPMGSNPATKPIEFFAHDPLRYVGDMLAWAHSATVSEIEALETLFVAEGAEFQRSFEAGHQAEPWSETGQEDFDGRKSLDQLVNRNLAGVARALRQRIEQVLQNQEDPVLLYKIANLISFYRSTFTRLLGASSSLSDTLTALSESALTHFRTIASEIASSLNSDLPLLAKDLQVPNFLNEALSTLSSLLKSYDSALTATASREDEFAPIVTQALDPFLSACETMAKDAPEPDRSIFLTNCFLTTKAVLDRYDFVEAKRSDLADRLAALMANLVAYQHAFFLHSSGLHPLLSSLVGGEGVSLASSSREKIIEVASHPAFQPPRLREASMALDDFLPSALMDAMDNLRALGSKDVVRTVTADGAERFCEDFEFVEGIMVRVDELRAEGDGVDGQKGEGEEGEEENEGMKESPDDGERLRDFFPRTSGEIRVLLS